MSLEPTTRVCVEPPPIARRLLIWYAVRDGGTLVGDLDEEFHTEEVPRRGAAAARAWYRRQAFLSLIAITLDATWDLVGPATAGLAAMLGWHFTVYTLLRSGLAIERPLAEMSPLTFALVWVFGGLGAAGFAGARLRPHRASTVALVVALAGISMLLIAVDEPAGLMREAGWTLSAALGALLGASIGRRWALGELGPVIRTR